MSLSTTGADTLPIILARQAQARGDAPFLVFEDQQERVSCVTYAEMERRASRMANALRRFGVAKGQTFHVHLPNCPTFYDCWLGGAKIGAIMVPTNPLSTADELAYVLSHADCTLSITQPVLLPAVVGAQSASARRPILLGRTDEALPGTVLLEQALADADTTLAGPPAIDAGDVVAILYTSGTTSRPKGVLITHASYLFVGEAVAQHLRVRQDDRWLIVLPLFHGNAQYYSSMSALVAGASIALIERFSASRWGRQAARHGATLASLFAAPIRMILAQPPEPTGDRENRLRATVFAQNVTEDQAATFERRFGSPLVQLYGMTETVAPPTINPLYGDRRSQSMGRAALWARLRIVDEAGQDVPTGAVGQLLVHGEPGRTSMAGYFKDPVATAATVRDGWLHTGDNVRADPDGYLYFVDRGKDMIKRAGENVATGEVERVVNEHPAVFESAAIGVADPMRDEAIKVFVVLHQGASASEEEIIRWCAERLAKLKVPSFVEFVDGLPRTSVGKIQKHVLRRLSAEHVPQR